jgi:DNA-directed RNA polymerase specialized sigma24 family protein
MSGCSPLPGLVADHSPAVWATALRILRHREDAQDCYQQTFLDAFRSAALGPANNWIALLLTIASAAGESRPQFRFNLRECQDFHESHAHRL